jgi:hypothetical protein
VTRVLDCKHRAAWLKIGLAARYAQALNLTLEPSELLSQADQEEHRRAYWSVYLLDKLVSDLTFYGFGFRIC